MIKITLLLVWIMAMFVFISDVADILLRKYKLYKKRKCRELKINKDTST